VNRRKGKLVATSRKTGRLPNNIIKKAPNADLLDGRDSKVYLDRYTRQQIDDLPSSRLLGYGWVNSDGTPRGLSFYFPGGVVGRFPDPGHYFLRIPGYSPGCVRGFPTVALTPQFGPGEGWSGLGNMTCGSGDVTMDVEMTDTNGTPTNLGFAFTIFSGLTPPASAARLATRSATTCDLRRSGVHCH
jgi:hypothetical protein